MKTCEHTVVHSSKADVFKIWALGDVHLGHINVDRGRLEQHISYIENDPNSIVFLTGDWADAITTKDPRFDPESFDTKYMNGQALKSPGFYQLEDAMSYIDRIKDKVACVITGNHEEVLHKHTGLDISHQIATRIGKPYLGYSGFCRLKFKRQREVHAYTVYMHHGRGSGRSKGSAANNLDKLRSMFDADIFLQGHIHNQHIIRCQSLYMNKAGKIKERHTMAAFTGSYMKTYGDQVSGYAERGQYAPSALGSVCIMLKPQTGEMDGSYNLVRMGL